MNCEKCGAEVKEGMVYCLKCGTRRPKPDEKQEVASTAWQSSGLPTQQEIAVNQSPVGTSFQHYQPPSVPEKETPDKLKNKKTLLIACIALALVAVIALVLFLVIPKTLKFDLTEYISIKIDGHDGYGFAKYEFSKTELLGDMLEKKKIDPDLDPSELSLDKYEDLWNRKMELERVINSIDITITPDSVNLSNGDTVTLEIEYDEESAKEAGIKFTGLKIETQVENLPTAKMFDPFETLTVSFHGVSPNGYISVDLGYSDDLPYLDSSYYVFDKRDGLSNGDTITVTLEISDEELMREGFHATKRSQSYTVEGLDEYVVSFESLSDDFVKILKSEAEDTVLSYVASLSSDKQSLSNLRYAGYVMQVAKSGEKVVSDFNYLYIIYSGTVSHPEGKFLTTDVYYPVRFKNIMEVDRTFTYEDNQGIQGTSEFYLIGGSPAYFTNTLGYTQPYSAYAAIVDSNPTLYSSTCGDGFEKFADYPRLHSLSDIDETYHATLRAEAKDYVDSFIASRDPEYIEVVEGSSYVGTYFLLNKDQNVEFAKKNSLIIVHSAVLKNIIYSIEAVTETIYFPVKYDGIVQLPGDEYMYTVDHSILGDFRWEDYRVSMEGYLDPEEMFSKLVVVNRDHYRYEMTDGLKKFGE